METDGPEDFAMPIDIEKSAQDVVNGLLPEKSKKRYELRYERFLEWKKKNKIGATTETNFLLILT